MRLIDADGLLELLKDDERYGYIDAADVINAPTIEAEPVKHGKWEIDSDFFPVCSNCKYKPLEALTRYCPNCGARMDGDINGKSS